MSGYDLSQLESDCDNGTYFLIAQKNIDAEGERIRKGSVFGVEGLYVVGSKGVLMVYLDQPARKKLFQKQNQKRKEGIYLSDGTSSTPEETLARINSGDWSVLNYWSMLAQCQEKSIVLDSERLDKFCTEMLAALEKPIAPFQPLVTRGGVYIEKSWINDPNKGVSYQGEPDRLFSPVTIRSKSMEFNYWVILKDGEISLAPKEKRFPSPTDSKLALYVWFADAPKNFDHPCEGQVGSAVVDIFGKDGRRVSPQELELWDAQDPAIKFKVHLAKSEDGSLEEIVLSKRYGTEKQCLYFKEDSHLVLEPVDSPKNRIIIVPGKYHQSVIGR